MTDAIEQILAKASALCLVTERHQNTIHFPQGVVEQHETLPAQAFGDLAAFVNELVTQYRLQRTWQIHPDHVALVIQQPKFS